MAESIFQRVDAELDKLLSGWNVYSYLLLIILLAYFISPLFLNSEPDTHPFLLARQASASPVRQSGESPVYRAPDIVHGWPLRRGLNIKDEGAPKWASGRDGDLRDLWKEAMKPDDASQSKPPARIITVMGRDSRPHEFEKLCKEINIVGKHIQSRKGTKVAIFLPNSVEFLVAFFASAFYGFRPVLIPANLPTDVFVDVLKKTNPDVLIGPAGTLSPSGLKESNIDLKAVIWVIEPASRHMGWLQGSKVGDNVAEWHGLIEQYEASTDATLPEKAFEGNPPDISCVFPRKNPEEYDVVEYSHANVIAGIAAQLNALPRNHRFAPQDLVLSLEPLNLSFPLCITLAAFFSKASVALSSAAGAAPDFDLAFQSVKPTIIIASSETVAQAQSRKVQANQGLFQKIHYSRQARFLAAGSMHKANSLLTKNGLRLIFTSERIGADSVPLSPLELTDMRILTGSRIAYALTAPKVAGAIAQTNILDYRNENTATRSHFGPPVGSVEIKVVDSPTTKIPDSGDTEHVGHLVVTGPAVAGGEINTEVTCKFSPDHTLSIAMA